MQLGLAQINTTVGDLAGNLARMERAYTQLKQDGAQLVLFPELCIPGYPPRDLLFKSNFVPDNLSALQRFAATTGPVPAVVGFVESNTTPLGRRFFNTAAWCAEGQVRHIARKCLLPSYDVFDEDRYFEAALRPTVLSWRGRKVALTICEDIWTGPLVHTARHYRKDPLDVLEGDAPDLLINLSASPWHGDKGTTRQQIIRRAAEKLNCPVAYVNAVGGNDELVFDGHSMVVQRDGRLTAGLAAFAEELRVVDLNAQSPTLHPTFEQEAVADLHQALVLATRDYAHKSGFKRALLGLSGGIDSAVTAAIAVEALGAEAVLGVSLPSRISSDHSQRDAEALARHLGMPFERLPIQGLVDAAEAALQPLFGDASRDVTEENLQARARGILLMALSNKQGRLLLSTGNKSEMAVGYCTLYGDMAGGLAVLADVAKLKVYALARHINRDGERIPQNTLDKPPSAELAPDQRDDDALPPYEVLDPILERYIEEGASSQSIIDAGFDEDAVRKVIRLVDLNEYKRKQAAPAPKVTPVAFGTGRRIPIVQKYVS